MTQVSVPLHASAVQWHTICTLPFCPRCRVSSSLNMWALRVVWPVNSPTVPPNLWSVHYLELFCSAPLWFTPQHLGLAANFTGLPPAQVLMSQMTLPPQQKKCQQFDQKGLYQSLLRQIYHFHFPVLHDGRISILKWFYDIHLVLLAPAYPLIPKPIQWWCVQMLISLPYSQSI